MRLIDAPAVVAERGPAGDRCAVVTLGRESAERDDTRLPCTRTGSWRFRGIASGLHHVRRGPWRGRDHNRAETRVSGPGARRMLLGEGRSPAAMELTLAFTRKQPPAKSADPLAAISLWAIQLPHEPACWTWRSSKRGDRAVRGGSTPARAFPRPHRADRRTDSPTKCESSTNGSNAMGAGA